MVSLKKVKSLESKKTVASTKQISSELKKSALKYLPSLCQIKNILR